MPTASHKRTQTSYKITTTFFDLTITHYPHKTDMAMTVHKGPFSTAYYPATLVILETQLPRVLLTKCFNDKKLPFRKEAKKTEIAHLFEHILLENLCTLLVATGVPTATFNGLTSWDWTKEKAGTFHITLDAGENTHGIFDMALQQSITVIEKVLASELTKTAKQSIAADKTDHAALYLE